MARQGGGDADQPGWQIRVVPNLYPIVGGPDASPGTTGAHEVLILSPDHRRSFGDLDDDGAIEALTALRDRTRAHLAAGRAYVATVVNHGRAAGASIAHPHAQLIALDFVPVGVLEALARVARRPDHDPLLDDLRRDAALVVSDHGAVVWCPWGSSSPFMMRVAHRDAGTNFDGAPNDVVAAVAQGTRDALFALKEASGDVAYNVVVHTAPPGGGPFHWYVEITPRLSVVAGFEMATGVLVNTTPPELAATTLHAAVA